MKIFRRLFGSTALSCPLLRSRILPGWGPASQYSTPQRLRSRTLPGRLVVFRTSNFFPNLRSGKLPVRSGIASVRFGIAPVRSIIVPGCLAVFQTSLALFKTSLAAFRTSLAVFRTSLIVFQTSKFEVRNTVRPPGSVPKLTGAIPDLTGAIPDLTGSIPDLNYVKNAMSGMLPGRLAVFRTSTFSPISPHCCQWGRE